MSTLDTAALWSATTLAFDEKKLGSAGLSVRQRKLLALLATPASVAQLAQSIALPEIDVQTALDRFAKLGLAQSDAAAPFNPMQARSQVLAGSAAQGVESSSRMPVMIGVAVAVLALMAASAWLLRGGTPTAPTLAPNTKNDAPTVRPPAATSSESVDQVEPSPNVAATSGAPGAVSTTSVAAASPARTPTTTVVPVVTAAGAPTAATLPAATQTAPVDAPLLVPGKTIVAPTPAVTNATPSAPSIIAPVTVAAPTPAPVAAAPAPTPPPALVAIAAVAPAALPPTTVVTAPPAATPTPLAAAPRPAPAREIKLVNRIEPTFPRGVDAERGSVRARLQVDARGVVTNVEIVESVPPRVFDRTVRNALQQWRYEPTGEAFSTAAEISFAR